MWCLKQSFPGRQMQRIQIFALHLISSKILKQLSSLPSHFLRPKKYKFIVFKEAVTRKVGKFSPASISRLLLVICGVDIVLFDIHKTCGVCITWS